MSLIIGFSGRARHGKTVCCDMITSHVRRHGGTAEVYDIGAMIQRYAVSWGRLPDIPRSQMSREHLVKLIEIGREKRAENGAFWIQQVLDAIDHEQPDVAMCPNLRYLNEARLFRKIGAKVVRCTRLNANGSVFISEDRPPNDPLETDLEFWPADYYLTTIGDQVGFMAAQAVALYQYLAKGGENQ